MQTKAQRDELRRLALQRMAEQQRKQEAQCLRRWTEHGDDQDEEEETFYQELNFNRD